MGAMTMRGDSPWAPKAARFRSPCSVLVGMPVEGPARWMSATTTGTSAMPASPSSSVISDNPGPAVAVITFLPAQLARLDVDVELLQVRKILFDVALPRRQRLQVLLDDGVALLGELLFAELVGVFLRDGEQPRQRPQRHHLLLP